VRLVTHELRSPLSVIKGYCQLVYGRMRKEGAKDAEFLAKMERSVDRMETLVNDLVDVSHIESGKLELSRERCDLCELCRDAVDEQAALHRDVDLSLPEGPVWVHADPGRIAQVLTNLLTNAFKYGDGTHPVSLVLTEETGGARLQVIDKGPGIPEEQLAHVFERFYRALGNKHAGGAFGGLGLGLYLCRELVERHNGTIEAKSTPGEGSTFTVTLPLGG
jgi:signal transduction histidine kinase